MMREHIDATRIYLECSCGRRDHLVVVELWRADEDFDVGISAQLNPRFPWWVRLIAAIRYVFGHNPCPFGTGWSDCILSAESILRLKKMMDEAEPYARAVIRDSEEFQERLIGDTLE